MRLYKPHGSLNWRQDHRISEETNRSGRVKLLSDIQAYGLMTQSQQICKYNFDYESYLGLGHLVSEPILALPYKLKTTFVFPENHKIRLIQDMQKVTHILTIGWRGSEDHFHKEILKFIPDTARLKILTVNTGRQDIMDNLNTSLGNKIGKIENYSSGFSEFVQEKQILRNFIT